MGQPGSAMFPTYNRPSGCSLLEKNNETRTRNGAKSAVWCLKFLGKKEKNSKYFVSVLLKLS